MPDDRRDELLFFDKKPDAYRLYLLLETRLCAAFDELHIKVQKTQITFSNRRVFGCVSLPRTKSAGDAVLIVTFGLPYRLSSPRILLCVEPYPNRYTHHIAISYQGDIDDALMGFLKQAYAFSAAKR